MAGNTPLKEKKALPRLKQKKKKKTFNALTEHKTVKSAVKNKPGSIILYWNIILVQYRFRELNAHSAAKSAFNVENVLALAPWYEGISRKRDLCIMYWWPTTMLFVSVTLCKWLPNSIVGVYSKHPVWMSRFKPWTHGEHNFGTGTVGVKTRGTILSWRWHIHGLTRQYCNTSKLNSAPRFSPDS